MKCEKCNKGWPEARVDTYRGGPTGLTDLCDDCLFIGIDAPPPAYDAAAKYVATYRPY